MHECPMNLNGFDNLTPMELPSYYAELREIVADRDSLRTRLAASESGAAALRAALEEILETELTIWPEPSVVADICSRALSIPAGTRALGAFRLAEKALTLAHERAHDGDVANNCGQACDYSAALAALHEVLG